MTELNMTPGLIPLPGHSVVAFEVGAGLKVDGVGMDTLGPRHLDGVCLHRAQGHGSVAWLLNPTVKGLTDWVISENADATMTQINFITGTNRDLAGWAQGPYRPQAASKRGRDFVARHGGFASSINLHLESIEVMGFYNEPVSENTRRDVVQWIASRAHDDGIPWSQFPIRNDGAEFVYGHRDFCGVDYKPCPGSVIWEWMHTTLPTEVQDVMRSYQEAAIPTTPTDPVPEYATPSPIPWNLGVDLGWQKLNGVDVYCFNGEVTSLRQVTPRAWASDNAPQSAAKIPNDTKVAITGAFDLKNGTSWYLDAVGNRLRGSAFDADFEVTPRESEAA